jgi:hypothetical protein
MFSREKCDVFLCQRYKYTVFWHVKVDKSYVQKSPIALTESPNKKIPPVDDVTKGKLQQTKLG